MNVFSVAALSAFALGAAVTTAAADTVPAPASATDAAPVKKVVKPAADPKKVICRTSPETGTRLDSVKICLTRAEWDEKNFRQTAALRGMSGSSAQMGR